MHRLDFLFLHLCLKQNCKVIPLLVMVPSSHLTNPTADTTSNFGQNIQQPPEGTGK